MLFDLKGRRRRVVQVTYLTLAILMGGGLVLFGIGGDVSGGLFDAFSDRSGSGNSIVDDRIEDNEKKVKKNPADGVALKALVRDWYQLATDEADPETGQFTDKGKERLAKLDRYWQLYLKASKKPDPSLASLVMNAYDTVGLNKPEQAVRAAEILSEARPSAQAFLQLTTYAAKAGQTRKAELAGKKAIDLAPKDERSTVTLLVEQAKQPQLPTGAAQPAP